MENKFIMRGYIVHDDTTEKRSYILVKPGDIKDKNVESALLVLTTDSLKRKMDLKLKPGDYIEAIFNVQSRRYLDEEGKKQYTQSLMVDSIRISKKVDGDFGRKERYPAAKNEGIVEGELLDFYKISQKCLRLSIQTMKNGRPSIVQCYRIKPRAKELLKDLKVGNIVRCKCHIQNRRVEVHGQRKKYQDVVIDKIENAEVLKR